MTNPNRVLTTAALVFTALVAGAAVMVYEFVAVRFLQRSFGTLLDVWACEIAVCMAGLAIGYALGGFLADRFRSWRVLGAVLMVAAVTALPMEHVAIGVGEWCLNQPIAWWHPLAAAFSSFLPLLALGTVMPQAVRLHVRDLDKVGKSAGWMAAVSTGGSIIGVLLVAMVLFPRFGVLESMYGTSAVLFVLGIVIIASGRFRRAAAAGGAAVLFIALGSTPNASAQGGGAQVLFEKYSAYHHILVVDNGDERAMHFDNVRQSLMSKKDPYSGGFEYTEFFHVPMVLNPAIDSALFVGLGGGTGPKSYFKHYPKVRIEAAEIDDMVVQVARKYFALPDDPRIRIGTTDGRMFIRRSRRQYGAIFMDAYGVGRYAGAIPFHLVTKEFFVICREHLVDGGCLAYNVTAQYGGANESTLAGIHATLREVFEQVYLFEARSSGNSVLVAQKFESAGAQRPENDPKAWPRGPWLKHPLTAAQFGELAMEAGRKGVPIPVTLPQRITQMSAHQMPPANAPVYTDNYAPVDLSPNLRRLE